MTRLLAELKFATSSMAELISRVFAQKPVLSELHYVE